MKTPKHSWLTLDHLIKKSKITTLKINATAQHPAVPNSTPTVSTQSLL